MIKINMNMWTKHSIIISIVFERMEKSKEIYKSLAMVINSI